jgi:mannose-6-phosphate isomerase-like protein (cupin superfamily)
MNKTRKVYQRPWGCYQVLIIEAGYQVKSITVNPHQRLSLQKHFQRKEHWFVVQGECYVQIGENTYTLIKGQSADISKGILHRIANQTDQPAVLIEVQLGSYLGEDDIIRLDDDYGRVT